MFTLRSLRLPLLLMVLVSTLSMTACKTVSTVPSVAPTPPEVRCKQPASPPIPAAPRKDKWLEWLPPLPGEKQGVARLSESAARWIVDVLGVAEKREGLRNVEHECLDALEKKGLITQ